MTDKPVKLTDAQLTTLQQVEDPNVRYDTHDFALPAFDELETLGLITIKRGGGWIPEPYLTHEGRAYLDALGIAHVALQPPPKSSEEHIAELEAALKLIRDILPYLNQPLSSEQRLGLVEPISEAIVKALGE